MMSREATIMASLERCNFSPVAAGVMLAFSKRKLPSRLGWAVVPFIATSPLRLPSAWVKAPKVNGLMLGAMVRNTQTGSTPDDGYAEGYYFNFITAGVAVKYYPFEKANFFTKADFGLAAVLTKNRFINDAGDQNFFHQFGIGSGGSIGLGYSFPVFNDKSKSIDVQIIYQQLRTRVEVNGIGDDYWGFGALNFSVAFSF